MLSNEPYLESLLDLFHEHIAICSETVHGEYSAVRPRERRQRMPNWVPFFIRKIVQTVGILWRRSESECYSPRFDGCRQQ